ncbi:hypothetical protein F5Y04DRAFT_270233 [Hypomontagnella monticulosa]|nr:hypothetical protein F5Y04DRAFT_270233 [Hypomontagnella monticulosa]
MASKRKADDFIYTLSDNEEIPNEEEDIPEPNPPKKKAKKNKKSAQLDEEENGVWGKKDEDDGAMDSDFEFAEDGTTDFRTEDFEGWGFEGAKKGINGAATKRIVDVDEIVRRRRGTKGDPDDAGAANGQVTAQEDDAEDDADEDEDIELDDEDDEVLAADGFGMGAASDEESDGDAPEDESDQEEIDEEDASDNDSVATPVDHPDDAEESDVSDDEEDPEEAAKREAFFAPEEKTPAGKQKGKSSFQNMSLSRPILRGLNSVGFNEPTPIQAKTIPLALEGKDLVGGAVTGSGKTGAFVVPILERLLYRPNKIPTSRVVILTPTRELAIQCHAVATKLASHTDIKFCLAMGGLSLKVQEAELRLRPDVIIATPGRFIDHMRNSASFSTDTIEILVLDEADRMLEDGFADELNEILTTLPKSRQTMLFSATMTSSVDRLIRAGLNKPVRVMVDSQRKTVDKLEQKFVRLRPGREEKRMGYLIHICKTMHTERVIIFFRQKKEAHRARIIFALFNLPCAELHGSMNQAQRIASVEAFRDGKVSYLLATDLASRGLDIKGVDTVINYEGPQTLEIYVHRVGRTARAGRSGVAITLAAEPDRKVVKAAVKAGKAQGAKISSLIIDPADADKWQDKIDDMSDEIEAIAREEKEEKQMAQVEMEIKKGENMVIHEDEIKSRPKRTWFETQHDKKKAKDAGRIELNGLKESLKKKGNGKLSNKDKKKLDAKSTRSEGMWKKGSAERAGKGAVLNFKNDKKKKVAPPRRFLPPRPHPHHRQSLLQYLFPRSLRGLRERYRERLIGLHLDTFPYYKHRIQSRIYRFILERERRRRERSRLVDHARRLFLGLPASNHKSVKDGSRATPRKMTTMPGYGVGSGNYGSEGGRERGTKRKKLAALAGTMYRASATAVNEIKESYYQTRSGDINSSDAFKVTIPGSFPDVAIVTNGNEQMVLFPSYAKKHERGQPKQFEDPGGPPHPSAVDMGTEDYWRTEWSRHEDEKAVVDVDVRGWLYSPHRGQMTRRNRIMVGLARQLSGIPAPRAQQADLSTAGEPSLTRIHQQHEEERERERIAREAKEIERRGRAEEEAAQKGKYSERPRDEDSESEGNRRRPDEQTRTGAQSPPSAPSSPTLKGRTATTGSIELTDAELAVANANLMARVAPFVTTPLVATSITIFFYNERSSQSRTVTTNDAGHFMIRAALDFIPTHVQPVRIIEPRGRSDISLGAREIFRNTFVRDEWYNTLDNLGLYPGSLHLKHYAGMLQGIFEPIMNDFPERKFLLVGDSGEADLEVILAIFIRDVTTPEQTGYFDSGFNARSSGRSSRTNSNIRLGQRSSEGSDSLIQNYTPTRRPQLPPRVVSSPKPVSEPVMGDLIDLSDEPEPLRRTETEPQPAPPPPKPAKPSSLQGVPAAPVLTTGFGGSGATAGKKSPAPTPPQPRRTSQTTSNNNSSTNKTSTDQTRTSRSEQKSLPLLPKRRTTSQSPSNPSPSSSGIKIIPPPPPPLPRRHGTPSRTSRSSPTLGSTGSSTFGFSRRRTGDSEGDFEPLPPPAGTGSGSASPTAASKKLDLWRRRLRNAQETLDKHGVALYTWRRGDEVVDEAVGIVMNSLKEMGVWR